MGLYNDSVVCGVITNGEVMDEKDDIEVEKYFGEIENKKSKRVLTLRLNNSDKINIEFAINFLLDRTVGETTEEVKQIFVELLEKVRKM